MFTLFPRGKTNVSNTKFNVAHHGSVSRLGGGGSGRGKIIK